VLGLPLYVIVRFRHDRNPVPARASHNTVIEMLWTVVGPDPRHHHNPVLQIDVLHGPVPN
jgi:hypothetical protein